MIVICITTSDDSDESSILRIQIQGHARRGKHRRRICSGVAVLSRTLAASFGDVDSLSYGNFDFVVPPGPAAQLYAEFVISGYALLAAHSPANVRIVTKVGAE